MKISRDASIDSLRGLAIITMVAANLAAMLLMEPHPLWLRIYGTFAAPLFVILAGMMVCWTAQKKERSIIYFVRRGTWIILVGALLDTFLWQLYPFTTVDVLYLIGLSLPLCALFLRLSLWWQGIIVFSIFGLTPILQSLLGYTSYPQEFDLNGQLTTVVVNQTPIWQHWIVDGWFPLFPWLGFALFGVLLARWRWQRSLPMATEPYRLMGIGLALILVGVIQFYFYDGVLYTRNGYSELFYPPTLAYITTAIGVFGLLLGILDLFSRFIFQGFCQTLGRHSLGMYVTHLILGELLVVCLVEKLSILYFVLAYLLILLALYWICLGIEKIPLNSYFLKKRGVKGI